jgi:CHAD domain-containing protein
VFSLKPDQPVTPELLRVVRDRLDSAIDLIAEDEDLTPVTVHNLRKRFKRLKALYRLVGPFCEQEARKETIRYRDLGRDLALSRDREVLEQTLVKLQFLTDDPVVIDRLEYLLNRLQRQDAVEEMSLPVNAERLRAALLKARAAAEQVLRGDFPRDLLIEGYLKTYRKSRRLWRILPESTQQEDWHEWRKRVKDDWYQTQLLKKYREVSQKPRLEKLRALADLLGYDHDLQNLSELIEVLTLRPHPADEDVQLLIDRQRRELQEEALQLGKKLYREKPSRIRDAFHGVRSA